MKVFKHINIRQLLPTHDEEEVLKIQVLWTELLNLNESFSKHPEAINEATVLAFESDARGWVRKFLEIYHRDRVTPYIHAMANHVGEFMRLHGAILPFTQQGLEKHNDMMTKQFFRATCHRGEDALIQILEKENRMEYLRDAEALMPKHHEVSCSNCKAKGHNMFTCVKPCTHCGSTPFRAHLIELGRRKVPSCTQDT